MKIFKRIAITSLVIFSWASAVQAFCPVCTLAVGTGVGLSRYLGIDDTISGLWIGGLTVSAIMWTLVWLDKKNIRFKGRKIIIAISYYVLIFAPLHEIDIMGHPLNTLWGIDKLLLGALIGSLGFLGAGLWYYRLKAQNNNHAYFSFQKVAMPVGTLLFLSLIFYFLTR
jgi:hypothetical protein